MNNRVHPLLAHAPGHMGGGHVVEHSTVCALAPLFGLAPGSVARRHRTVGLKNYPRALLVGIALGSIGLWI
jgi:hypothetical protein